MVYLDVEIKKRELLSRIYLASLLADSGSIVLVGKRLSARDYLARYPCSLLVRKNARLSGLKLTAELVDAGVDVVSLDEEGFMIDSLEAYGDFDNPAAMVRLISKYFLWGSEQKKTLSKKYGSYEKKFFSFGNPRVALWKNRFFGFLDREADEIKGRFDSFILVSSNFGLVTNSDFAKKNISYAIDGGNDHIATMFEERYQRESFVFSAFVEISKSLADAGSTVVFRPHPSDNIEHIKERFRNSGVIVDASFEIGPWILACECLIHNCCSSGLEAYLMGRRVIAFEPSGVSVLETRSVNDLGLVVSSSDELLRVVACSRARACEINDQEPSLGNTVEIDPDLEGLVAELLESERLLNSDRRVKNQKLHNRAQLWIGCKHFIMDLRQYLLTKLWFDRDRLGARRASYNKFPRTSIYEIESFLDCLKQHGVISREVTVASHDTNCFKIERLSR